MWQGTDLVVALVAGDMSFIETFFSELFGNCPLLQNPHGDT